MAKKSVKKKKENSIHIKLENDEAIISKKDLLSSEINLLRISQIIENYRKLRSEEIKKKRLILKRSKEIKKDLSKLQIILPNLKIPKILKGENYDPNDKKEKTTFEIPKNKGNIERQLLEIQERLNKLSQ